MPAIKVTVLRGGYLVDGHRVVLEFSGIDGGMSKEEYTGSDGTAEFEVEGEREGDVFVDGADMGSWDTYRATDITVNL